VGPASPRHRRFVRDDVKFESFHSHAKSLVPTGWQNSGQPRARRNPRLRDAMPKVVDPMKRGRGRPKLAHPKSRVSLRLDPEIVAAYKASGKGWQSRINETLARAVARRKLKRGRTQAA
jgi:uncharacterized protein (DUF4415 family)